MILVTGASGNVGQAVVAALRARGAALRTAGRRAAGDGAVALDFSDPATFAPAARGCDAVFLLRPPAIARVKPTLNAFVDVARAAGVRHVVFLSVAGADRVPVVPHHAVEAHLRAGPPDWTVLRPGFFAQNLGDAYARDIAEDDRLHVPAGAGRVAFVDVRDVGEVAARILVAPADHRGAAYTLTGPEAVTFDTVARRLTDALGRPIRYEPASVLGYMAHLRRRGLPLAQVLVQTALHVGLRFGQAEAVDPTLAALLEHPPRTIADYARDHASRWARV